MGIEYSVIWEVWLLAVVVHTRSIICVNNKITRIVLH